MGGITDSVDVSLSKFWEMVDVSLSKFWEMVNDREPWRDAGYGVTKSCTRLRE